MKKKVLLVVLCLVIVISMMGCMSDKNSSYVQEVKSNLVNIDGLLSYDMNTKIVYYYFKDSAGVGNCKIGFGFMSPYISEDGKFCKYDINERKIIEIK